MIQVQNLRVWYGDQAVIRDLSLHIAPRERVLLSGPAGSGKSTLARVLAGLMPGAVPARVEGRVEVAGFNLLKDSGSSHPVAEVAQRVGIVFQNPSSQLFHLSVGDEVAFGPHNLGLPEAAVQERVAWALDALNLTSLRHNQPGSLSGGQQQRVAIAAALAMQPQVLVLDEPTASLDVPGTRSVISALKHLRELLGMTIVLIEHRLADVARLTDRVILMEAGQIIADGELETVLGNRVHLRSLGLRRPVEDPLDSWPDLLAKNEQLDEDRRPLLELKGVTAGYNRHPVIKDIHLALHPGEFVALVGDNGAGKSTLALVAAGLLKPSQGKLLYDQGQKPRLGLDISLLFQNPADQLFTDSVDEEVSFAPLNYACFQQEDHDQVLAQADLLALRSRRPTALSVGQQQRTALAACLSSHPCLVILDEPTLGQDWGHLQRLMDYLSKLNAEGTAILLITHDYKLVHRYAQRVVLMKDGRITLDGRLRNLKQNEEIADEILNP